MNKTIRTEIYSRLRKKIPNPETELNYIDPFELLIAVILSAQATDISVNKATSLLYPVANTPRGILDLGVSKLKRYIKTIGLYNAKAENIIKTCRILLEQFDGEVPRTRAELESLPGVGRKTANVSAQYRVWRTYNRRRYAHFSCIQPYRPRDRKDATRGRKTPDAIDARRIQAGCAPLAHSSRALHL